LWLFESALHNRRVIGAGRGEMIIVDCERPCESALQGNRPQRTAMPEIWGSIHPTATIALANRLGVEPNLDINLRQHFFDQDSLVISPKSVQAVSKFLTTEGSAHKILSGSGERTEVHGTYTIPACIELGKLMLGLGAIDGLELVKHQISKPIRNELQLVAYRAAHEIEFPQSDRVLNARLKINGNEVFVRGYESNIPVVHVLQDTYEPEVVTGSPKLLYSNQNGRAVALAPEPFDPRERDTFSQSPASQFVRLLDQVERAGKYLLFEGFFPFKGGNPYVSRIKDCSISSADLLCAPEPTLYISFETATHRSQENTHLLDAQFKWCAGKDCAQGTLTIGVKDAKL
jgi:hypothetical protein